MASGSMSMETTTFSKSRRKGISRRIVILALLTCNSELRDKLARIAELD
jgi:hypothetical protein